jgi:hypothetical protein
MLCYACYDGCIYIISCDESDLHAFQVQLDDEPVESIDLLSWSRLLLIPPNEPLIHLAHDRDLLISFRSLNVIPLIH